MKMTLGHLQDNVIAQSVPKVKTVGVVVERVAINVKRASSDTYDGYHTDTNTIIIVISVVYVQQDLSLRSILILTTGYPACLLSSCFFSSIAGMLGCNAWRRTTTKTTLSTMASTAWQVVARKERKAQWRVLLFTTWRRRI